MKIEGRDAMYRSFEGYNVTLKIVNMDTDEIKTTVMYTEGKFASDDQAKTWAMEHYVNGEWKAFKATAIETVKYKVAMFTEDFVKAGFLIDDDLKPIKDEHGYYMKAC